MLSGPTRGDSAMVSLTVQPKDTSLSDRDILSKHSGVIDPCRRGLLAVLAVSRGDSRWMSSHWWDSGWVLWYVFLLFSCLLDKGFRNIEKLGNFAPHRRLFDNDFNICTGAQDTSQKSSIYLWDNFSGRSSAGDAGHPWLIYLDQARAELQRPVMFLTSNKAFVVTALVPQVLKPSIIAELSAISDIKTVMDGAQNSVMLPDVLMLVAEYFTNCNYV